MWIDEQQVVADAGDRALQMKAAARFNRMDAIAERTDDIRELAEAEEHSFEDGESTGGEGFMATERIA